MRPGHLRERVGVSPIPRQHQRHRFRLFRPTFRQRVARHRRLRFQTGAAPVVVFTPTASLSLHAGELLPDGRHATTAPRVGLFHQPRYSGIAGKQVTGRTHRDGQRSNWHVAYAAGTVEEKVARLMVERYAAATDTVGGDTSGLSKIAALLGCDWLPSDVLTDT